MVDSILFPSKIFRCDMIHLHHELSGILTLFFNLYALSKYIVRLIVDPVAKCLEKMRVEWMVMNFRD